MLFKLKKEYWDKYYGYWGIDSKKNIFKFIQITEKYDTQVAGYALFDLDNTSIKKGYVVRMDIDKVEFITFTK